MQKLDLGNATKTSLYKWVLGYNSPLKNDLTVGCKGAKFLLSGS